MVSSLRHTVFKNFGKIDYLHYFRRMIKDYETKKYTAIREGLTEVVAIPTYIGCGALAAKLAKKVKLTPDKLASVEENLRLLGIVSLDTPSTIRIYPKDFESKDMIRFGIFALIVFFIVCIGVSNLISFGIKAVGVCTSD